MFNMKNIFIRDLSYYKRNLNPLKHYMKQTSFYLHKMTGLDIDKCKSMIKSSAIENIKVPMVNFYKRDIETGDKYTESLNLQHYIEEVVKDKDIISPSFTVYCSENEKESLLSSYVDHNSKLRSEFKKEAYDAQSKGDLKLYAYKEASNLNKKMFNNSISGALGINGNSLTSPSAHPTLTSTTRMVTSIANGSNEKLIAGNRHYFNVNITMNNLIKLSSSVDDGLDKMMKKFDLKCPTYDDVIKCIKLSTDFYWKDKYSFKIIEDFVIKLTPLERAGVVYIGDFYHVRIHNEEFVKNLIKKLSTPTNYKIDNPLEYIEKLEVVNSDIINLSRQLNIDKLKGKSKNYTTLTEDEVMYVASTCDNVLNTLNEYKDFITSIFLTDNMPLSVVNIKNIMRKTVVVSDTDSTCFEVVEWINWYTGSNNFTELSYRVGGVVMYIATQAISHQLAMFSMNVGISRKKINKLAMKAEFVFPVLITSEVTKHYYGVVYIKEGYIYSEPKLDIKGVHLLNNTLPNDLKKGVKERMMLVINNVLNNKKVSIVDEINNIKTIEKNIINSLVSGDTKYYKKTKIKESSSYKLDKIKSPYKNHTFWIDVFKNLYGEISEPPYEVIKIPTTLVNKTLLNNWVENHFEGKVKEDLIKWLIKHNKTTLPRIYISEEYVSGFGIPKEIIPIIDRKAIVLELTNTYRMFLVSLGYFPKHKTTLTNI